MNHEKYTNITARLGEILIEERELLRHMKIGELVNRSTEKLALVKELEGLLAGHTGEKHSNAIANALASLAQLAQANGQHFTAVRKGLSNVVSRLSHQSMETDAGAYNQYGEQVKFRGSAGGYLRKV